MSEDYRIYQEKFLSETSELLDNFPLSDEYQLDSIYNRVRVLLDFMELIEKHKLELNNPLSVTLVKTGFTPSAQLFDYLIQEISEFYTYVNRIKNKFNFPEPPKYWEKLKEFRNSIVHKNKNAQLKSLADCVNLLRKNINSIGALEIVEDFIDYARKVKYVFRDLSKN